MRTSASRRATVLLVVLAAFGLLAATEQDVAPRTDPVAALNEGNRLFRDGRLEDALEAYRGGWDPHHAHPTLIYNLATTLHHLDRLPEAILWYRRGAGSDDPWLEENLWLARRTLGSQTLDASGWARLSGQLGRPLRWTAVGLSWAVALLIAFFPGRVPRWSLVALTLLAMGTWTTAIVGDRWGARPAVLLEDCSTSAGDLPAGTEAWVRPAEDGWRVAAASSDALCPQDAVAVVDITDRR